MRLLRHAYALIGIFSGVFSVSRAFLPVCNTRASESKRPRLNWKFHERDCVKSRHEGIPCRGSALSKRAGYGSLAIHFPYSDSSNGRGKGPLQCVANDGDPTAENSDRSEVSLDTARSDSGVPSSLASSDSKGPPVVHSKEAPSDGKLGSKVIISEWINDVLGGLTATPWQADGSMWMNGQGLLNLCVLVTAGLWVVHSIITVDAGIWRGWTFQETLMRIPWDNWGSYETGLSEHPIITKTAINCVIYLLGDWLSQVNWGRDEDRALWEFDLARTLRNGLIGALFGPVVHYYYEFSDHVLPPNIPVNRPFKIVMDQSGYFCTKCAVYIALVSLLRGDSVAVAKETVKEKVPGVVTTGWRFWPFVHIFTYFVVPPRHRVLWVNCVDLLWNSILAGMTSAAPTAEAESSELGGTGQQGESTKSSQVVAVTTSSQAESTGR